jgi:hypothetical protein
MTELWTTYIWPLIIIVAQTAEAKVRRANRGTDASISLGREECGLGSRVDVVDRSDLGQEDSLCSGLERAPNVGRIVGIWHADVSRDPRDDACTYQVLDVPRISATPSFGPKIMSLWCLVMVEGSTLQSDRYTCTMSNLSRHRRSLPSQSLWHRRLNSGRPAS